MKAYLWRCYFSTIVICLCGVAQIYNITIVNNLYPIGKEWFLSFPNNHLTDFFHQWGLVASSITIGILLSTSFSGLLADRLGRKWTMVIACLCHLIGAVFTALLYPIEQLYVVIIGRFFTGIGQGLATTIELLWIGEFSPIQQRGFFLSFILFFSGFGDLAGIFVSTPELLGRQNLWMIVLVLGNITVILLLPVLLCLPESPSFLYFKNGCTNETLKSIEFYRGPENLHSVLEQLQAEQAVARLSLRNVLNDHGLRNTLILVVLLIAFIRITGNLHILMFSTPISISAGLSDSAAAWTTTFMSGIKFVSSLPVLWLVKKVYNRKFYIIVGILWCALCDVGLGAILAVVPNGTTAGISTVTVMAIARAVGVMLHGFKQVAAFELCSQEIRANALVVGRIVSTFLAAVVAYSFLPLSNKIGMWPQFVFCAVASVGVGIYFKKNLPETGNMVEEQQPLL